MSEGFIPKHCGYQELLAYQRSEIVYDTTIGFCRDLIDDQMVQAARLGNQQYCCEGD